MKNNIEIDFDLKDQRWAECLPDYQGVSRQVVSIVLSEVGFSDLFDQIEVSVILTNDAEVQELNNSHRGYDKPTNVLSFPAHDISPKNFAEIKNTSSDFVMLGDIVFGYETVLMEARAQGKEVAKHYAHLLVHSILHLLGYIHENDAEALEMEALEVRLLSKMSIESPYELKETA